MANYELLGLVGLALAVASFLWTLFELRRTREELRMSEFRTKEATLEGEDSDYQVGFRHGHQQGYRR